MLFIMDFCLKNNWFCEQTIAIPETVSKLQLETLAPLQHLN
jgi:hypothetical protein